MFLSTYIVFHTLTTQLGHINPKPIITMPGITNENEANRSTESGTSKTENTGKGASQNANLSDGISEELPTRKLERLIFRLHRYVNAMVCKITQNMFFLNRCNRLFRPAEDLGSVLTTFNYSLYLLAYVFSKATAVKSNALFLLRRQNDFEIAEGIAGTDMRLPSSPMMQPESSSFAKLGNLIYTTRATLRLFGLLPIFGKARQLKRDPGDKKDPVFAVDVVQCTMYATFQLLENIAFLMENGVISQRALGRWAGGATSRVAWLYRMAHRAWLMGVMCDFAKLVLKGKKYIGGVQNGTKSLTKEQSEEADGWYEDWVAPLAWLFIGWKLSDWGEEEDPSFHLGLHGLAGIIADLKKTLKLWRHTEKG
jgi:hypothetical protein